MLCNSVLPPESRECGLTVCGCLLALPSFRPLVEFVRLNPAGAMVAGSSRLAVGGDADLERLEATASGSVTVIVTAALLPLPLRLSLLLPHARGADELAHPMLNVSAGLNIVTSCCFSRVTAEPRHMSGASKQIRTQLLFVRV